MITRLFKISVLLLLFLFSSCQTKEIRELTVIKNTTIFDGHDIHFNTDLFFTQDSIIRISSEEAFPKGTKFVDGTGKTIIPPLLNAHVHVMDSINLYHAQEAGIFGMLDLFSTDKRAKYFRSFNGRQNCAHFYSSNVGATVPGGHGTQFGINIPTINNKISPKQFIKDRLKEGSDFIKITQETSMNMLSDSLLKLVIKESEVNNLVTVAHISDHQNAEKLYELGVDGLAHIWYRSSPEIDSTHFGFAENKEFFVIPTLSVIKRVIENHGQKHISQSK